MRPSEAGVNCKSIVQHLKAPHAPEIGHAARHRLRDRKQEVQKSNYHHLHTLPVLYDDETEGTERPRMAPVIGLIPQASILSQNSAKGRSFVVPFPLRITCWTDDLHCHYGEAPGMRRSSCSSTWEHEHCAAVRKTGANQSQMTDAATWELRRGSFRYPCCSRILLISGGPCHAATWSNMDA
jgi:hypothetical protein